MTMYSLSQEINDGLKLKDENTSSQSQFKEEKKT